ncbi:DUF742 domain-containing protein [Streptomyces sp. NPDC020681]|uniref:DUF742 domain-containing protein n=1 Tax=Streptomyces sp. NPDC020681 TaxID=3365083 RepID=UPI00379F8A75
MAVASGDAWTDSALGDVRPYAITGGRTRPKYTLQLTSRMSARPAASPAEMDLEIEALLGMCSSEPRSVAEIAARMIQPVQVTKILICDLLDLGALTMNDAAVNAGSDEQILEAVLHGLRTLP